MVRTSNGTVYHGEDSARTAGRMMITLESLDARLNELVAQRDQLVSQIMQAQANVNAFNGAIEEVTRLRDLLAEAEAQSAGEENEQ